MSAIRNHSKMVALYCAQQGWKIAESDYFKSGWAQAFWGYNYPKLLAVKDKYDPTGLFYVHHDVRKRGLVRRRVCALRGTATD